MTLQYAGECIVKLESKEIEMFIGEVSKKSNILVKTIRYDEEFGLLNNSKRLLSIKSWIIRGRSVLSWIGRRTEVFNLN